MEISKRVEKFIQDCTRTCSNELIAVQSRAGKEVVSYHEWLTPDQAKKAVEIAREETYNKIWNWLAKHINDYVVEGKGRDIDLMFDDIKQAMKDG